MSTNGTRLISTGKEAMNAARTLLKTAHPYIHNGFPLRPGTVWSGNKMLIQATPMVAIATIDDRLYEFGIDAFLRDESFNALRQAGKSAEGWCVIAEVEMGILCSLIAPLYLAIGMTCAKAGLFYVRNKPAVDAALLRGPQIVQLLGYMRKKYPLLTTKLALAATWAVLEELKDGHPITREHVAEFIAEALADFAKGHSRSIKKVIEVLVKVGLHLARKKLPGIVGHAASAAANRHGEDLCAYLNQLGFRVTQRESDTMMKEIAADPAAPIKLKELEGALRGLLPLLEAMNAEAD